MTNSITKDDILNRAETVVVEMHNNCEPLEKSYLKATISGLGILATVATETFMAVMAVHANWQALSSGQDVGSQLQCIGFCIGVGMLSGHSLLHDNAGTKPSGSSIRGWLRKLHIIPIVAVIGGMGIFTAMTIAQAAGGDDGVLGLSGKALSVVAGSLFALSFMACNKLVGVFLPALNAILSERAKLAKIKKLEAQIQAAVDCNTALEALQSEIDEDEKSDALYEKVAAEAATIVGKVSAEAHDAYVSRAALEGLKFGPEDTLNVSPDTPLEALKTRADYLKSLTFTHFFKLLKKDA